MVPDEPQLFSTPDATVGQPEISEGSVESKEPAPTVSIDTAVGPDSAVNADLADRGAQVPDIVAGGRVPASL